MIGTAQREILDALIELYDKKKEAVKGEDISQLLKRSPGTIRNQMQTLRALGYVEGVPGPKGGYTPSLKSYEELGLEPIENPHEVPIFVDDKKIEGLSAHKILFIKVPHPNECKAIISITGDTRKIADGDNIKVGPTPVNHIIIKGVVSGRDDVKREILITTGSITSIPKGTVGDIATRKLITIPANSSLEECGKILLDSRINAAPIVDDGQLTGIVTMQEIVRALIKGRRDAKAKDIAIGDIYTIGKEAKIITCIKRMEKLDVGRFIVTDDGKPAGIITRTDILQRMVT
jgi:hypothetical protein